MKKKVYSSKSKFNYIKVEFKRGLNHMGISSYDFNISIEASWRQCEQCNLGVHRFLGLTSTKQGVNVTCSRPLRTAPGQGSNQGSLGIKSDTLTTAPVPPLSGYEGMPKIISVF